MMTSQLKTLEKYGFFYIFIQKFPDYHFAKDMMRYTIEANLCPMLTDAILDILNQLKKKTEKEVCKPSKLEKLKKLILFLFTS